MPSANARTARVLKVGLTGGFGSGKSTVLAMLRRKGARVLDADEIVRRLFSRDAGVRKRIARRFGGLDKKAIAARVFDRPSERRALERILHPAVRRRISEGMEKARRGVVVADIPLLFESGWQKRFDLVVVVHADRKRRMKRLESRGFTARDFERRARAQWPLERKARLADHVIDNNGTKARTKKQIDEIWKQLTNHVRVARGKNGLTERS